MSVGLLLQRDVMIPVGKVPLLGNVSATPVPDTSPKSTSYRWKVYLMEGVSHANGRCMPYKSVVYQIFPRKSNCRRAYLCKSIKHQVQNHKCGCIPGESANHALVIVL